MKHVIHYSDLSQKDLFEMGDYYFENVNAQIAINLTDDIVDNISLLKTQNLGHRYDDGGKYHDLHVMTFTIRRYRIFYWIDPNSNIIWILRILHGSRNVDRIMAESSFPFLGDLI